MGRVHRDFALLLKVGLSMTRCGMGYGSPACKWICRQRAAFQAAAELGKSGATKKKMLDLQLHRRLGPAAVVSVRCKVPQIILAKAKRYFVFGLTAEP